MKKVISIVAVVTCLIFGYLFYQYYEQQKELTELHIYQNVIQEKTGMIYDEAKHWEKPIKVDLKDSRLNQDYQIMADFMLGYLVQRAEYRNQYLRDLTSVHWDKFLDIRRLEKDKKQNYKETEEMLRQVNRIVESYQDHVIQQDKNALSDVRKLHIKPRFRRYLTQSFFETQKQNNHQQLFELERESLSKAFVLFEILKKDKWENNNNRFMFYEDQAVDQFNQLYSEMVNLDKKMKEISQESHEALKEQL